MKAQTATQTTFTWLLGATAAISLLVGGISIMNIMLMAIADRTREIGLRIAIGARRTDIMLQFLIEATALCISGGAIGIIAGIATAVIAAKMTGWPIVIAPNAVLLAITAAGATGILFGFVPARRAALMNPIEALRSE